MRELLIVQQSVGWKKNKNKKNDRCEGLQTGATEMQALAVLLPTAW
jgi:hypothetical protein